jgi:hypothetical protein
VDLQQAVGLKLQRAAWNACQELKRHGGYLNLQAVPPPKIPLAAGDSLTAANLEGTWRGQIRFYPGAGPTEMVLKFERVGDTWKGHLNINYSAKDFVSEAIDLPDLLVGRNDFTFSDPASAGVNKFKVMFRGVKVGAKLRGRAETTVEGKVDGRDYKLEVLGDWELHR